MTLCLAWRNPNGKIRLASDSRITLNGKYSDYGIKIFSVPVRVYLPAPKRDLDAEVAHENIFGMAFSGSFLGVQLLREYLFVVLQNLQCIPGFIDYSFEAVCKTVAQYYPFLLTRIYENLQEDIAIDFFFTGFCPKDGDCKIAKFYVTYNNDYTAFHTGYNILQAVEFLEFIGGGQTSIFAPLNGRPLPDNVMLKMFSSAMNGACGPSVGGNLQHGSFDNKNNFKTSGVIVLNKNNDSAGSFIAGIDMQGIDFCHKPNDLFFRGSFIDLL